MEILKKKQLKCYLYTRVSTSMQVDGYSLDAQRDKLRKYAAYEDMIVAGEYSDEGFSGKNIQGRQEFQRMLNDIQDGKDDVPRRRAGSQPLPLCKDHPAGEVGRVLRAFRHLRQGGILPRDDDRQRGEPADRQRQCGRRLPHRAVRRGIRTVPGVLPSGRDGINFIKSGNGESCPAQLSFYCDFQK